MRLVHYSKQDDFSLAAIDTAGEGEGCFFYPDGNHIEWHNRTPSYWLAPDEIIEEVQRFEAGEFDNENEVIEVFIRAENFDKLVEVY